MLGTGSLLMVGVRESWISPARAETIVIQNKFYTECQ